jgi:hypothetical protein
MGKKKIIMLIFLMPLLVLCAGGLTIFFIRAFSERQLDDVTPGIPCSDDLLEKSDVLFVVPNFEGNDIGNNSEWCEKIILLGKRPEMHGVYHSYNEFYENRNESYLDKGIIGFERCFGEKPSGFKAPQMKLSEENKRMITERGLKNYGPINQILHKAYHCNDSGVFSNAVIDWI